MNNYQARLDSIVEDFAAPESGTAAPDVGPYRGRVPEALIDCWQQNGIGTILDGYFQFCDPARYSGVVRRVFAGDPEIHPEQTHVLGFGAFGTIIAWNEVYQNVTIDLVNGQVSCQALVNGKTYDPNIAVTSEVMLLDDPTFDEYDADAQKLFKPARSKLGKLGMGQIYGFRPILALGGNRALANLSICEALPHMAILAQAHEMRLMDNAPFPPQPVRRIGS
ncbi:GAD-like domain-containing protein [Rhizobium bangladeshense]|uniref:GAD-like domain-containing protein n=1 Tax=Rhizobium bangladeshense TaxID=1138189 RepID=UPI0007E578AA|nr:GAD-like domain-containing protein [Rhizobium bangladeshense]